MQVTDMKSYSYWKLYVDGASRANPGLSGVGIVITKDDIVFDKLGFYTGIKTNNQAEYLALIIGLIYLKRIMQNGDLVMIVSDSELMVRQIRGEYRVKNQGLQFLFCCAKKLLIDINFNIAHVVREQNTEADKQANMGIDKKIRVPDEIITILHDHAITL